MLVDTTKNLLISAIKKLNITDNDAVVLKGFPLSWAGIHTEATSLEAINKNKLFSFITITKERAIFSYEEFFLLHSFVISQYDHIYILTNNLFNNLFPISISLSAETKKNLLIHFADPDDVSDEMEIKEDLDILNIFKGIFCKNNDELIGAYNDEELLTSSEKIIVRPLFEATKEKLKQISEADTASFFDLIEESDYVHLVRMLYEGTNEIHIRTANYTGDRIVLLDQLSKLQYYGQNQFTIYEVVPSNNLLPIQHHKEYSKILKEYWGYDSFRDFKKFEKRSRRLDTVKEGAANKPSKGASKNIYG